MNTSWQPYYSRAQSGFPVNGIPSCKCEKTPRRVLSRTLGMSVRKPETPRSSSTHRQTTCILSTRTSALRAYGRICLLDINLDHPELQFITLGRLSSQFGLISGRFRWETFTGLVKANTRLSDDFGIDTKKGGRLNKYNIVFSSRSSRVLLPLYQRFRFLLLGNFVRGWAD